MSDNDESSFPFEHPISETERRALYSTLATSLDLTFKGVPYAQFIFDPLEPGGVVCISNCERADLIQRLDEWRRATGSERVGRA